MVMADEQSLLQLFTEVVPKGQWQEWQGGPKRTQIYTLPVVVAMMLLQRLNERGSQQEAVHQVVADDWTICWRTVNGCGLEKFNQTPVVTLGLVNEWRCEWWRKCVTDCWKD